MAAQGGDPLVSGNDDNEGAVPRRRRWGRFFLALFVIFILLVVAVRLLIGHVYQGPRTLADVVAVMPGVPLFPLTEVAPSNARAQRGLAIPLRLLRMQGVRHAEAAQLQAPADDYFIVAWYRRLAPSQGWSYAGEETLDSGTRLLFLRKNEGLQVFVGATSELYTPYQLIYLDGMTNTQIAQIATALPKVQYDALDTPPPPPPAPTPAPAPAPTPPAPAPANNNQEQQPTPTNGPTETPIPLPQPTLIPPPQLPALPIPPVESAPATPSPLPPAESPDMQQTPPVPPTEAPTTPPAPVTPKIAHHRHRQSQHPQLPASTPPASAPVTPATPATPPAANPPAPPVTTPPVYSKPMVTKNIKQPSQPATPPESVPNAPSTPPPAPPPDGQ